MKWDNLMDSDSIKFIEGLPEYESLITNLVLEHKKNQTEFRNKHKQFTNIVFEEFKLLMTQKGFKVENIENQLIAQNSKFTIKLYEQSSDVLLYFTYKEMDKNYHYRTIEKHFKIKIETDIDNYMSEFAGWSFYDKLYCYNSDHKYTVDYYKSEYDKLTDLLSEQIKILNEITRDTFFINLDFFVKEGGFFGNTTEKRIGTYKALQELLDKAVELI